MPELTTLGQPAPGPPAPPQSPDRTPVVLAASVLVALAVIALLVACSNGRDPDDRLSLPIEIESSTGVEGSGSVEEAPDGTRIELEFQGLPEGEYRAALREGSCGSAGADLADLGPVFAGATGNGGVSQLVERPITELADTHVAVTQGDSDSVVACGRIEGTPTS